MGQALRSRRVHDRFQSLKNLDLLISRLTIALYGVEHVQLGLAIGIEWDALAELALLVLQPVLNLLLALEPGGLLLFILLQEFSSFGFELFFASFLRR